MEQAEQTIPFGVTIPFVEHLGFRLRLFEDGRSRIDFDPRPEHMNSFAVAHGGAVMTLMDVGMSAAARSLAPEMGVVTIELKTSFMRPCTGLLSCRARLLHRTSNLAFVEATVVDAQEQACAHGTATFKYVQRRPPGAHSPGVISTD